jgi:hypothetical protein
MLCDLFSSCSASCKGSRSSGAAFEDRAWKANSDIFFCSTWTEENSVVFFKQSREFVRVLYYRFCRRGFVCKVIFNGGLKREGGEGEGGEGEGGECKCVTGTSL